MNTRAAAAALALLLGACATAPRNPNLPDLTGVPQAFEMSGRLAWRDGQRNEIAGLRWTHRGVSDLWVIASPLGNEVARIESDASGATLTQASGGGVQADSFAELTERALGVAIEPADLARWLHGAKPPAPSREGWNVTIEDTQKAGSVDIARRIIATRGEASLRLVVDDYRALPP
jgi:outer membrane biogenesis lipoprotein LolB